MIHAAFASGPLRVFYRQVAKGFRLSLLLGKAALCDSGTLIVGGIGGLTADVRIERRRKPVFRSHAGSQSTRFLRNRAHAPHFATECGGHLNLSEKNTNKKPVLI